MITDYYGCFRVNFRFTRCRRGEVLLTIAAPNPLRWHSRPAMDSMNILHVFRAPVGGLFRHVLDLTRAQIARGHRVGIIADSVTGGARAEEILHSSSRELALGLSPFPDAAACRPWRSCRAQPRHGAAPPKPAPMWCTATAPKAAPMPA